MTGPCAVGVPGVDALPLLPVLVVPGVTVVPDPGASTPPGDMTPPLALVSVKVKVHGSLVPPGPVNVPVKTCDCPPGKMPWRPFGPTLPSPVIVPPVALE